jgi:hypothetical protein
MRERIRRKPGRAMRGGAPVTAHRHGAECERQQRPRQQQCDEEQQPSDDAQPMPDDCHRFDRVRHDEAMLPEPPLPEA